MASISLMDPTHHLMEKMASISLMDSWDPTHHLMEKSTKLQRRYFWTLPFLTRGATPVPSVVPGPRQRGELWGGGRRTTPLTSSLCSQQLICSKRGYWILSITLFSSCYENKVLIIGFSQSFLFSSEVTIPNIEPRIMRSTFVLLYITLQVYSLHNSSCQIDNW